MRARGSHCVRVLGAVALLSAVSCASPTRRLKTRAAFDMQCPESELEIHRLTPLTRGVRGCGQQLTYVLAHSGEWILNADSREVPNETDQSLKSGGTRRSGSEHEAAAESAVDFPEEALGFKFGISQAVAEAACRDGGHQWKAGDSLSRCSGTPADVKLPTRSILKFCGDRLCGLTVESSVSEDELPTVLEIWKEILNRYGLPKSSTTRVPEECREQLHACLATNEAKLGRFWAWEDWT